MPTADINVVGILKKAFEGSETYIDGSEASNVVIVSDELELDGTTLVLPFKVNNGTVQYKRIELGSVAVTVDSIASAIEDIDINTPEGVTQLTRLRNALGIRT